MYNNFKVLLLGLACVFAARPADAQQVGPRAPSFSPFDATSAARRPITSVETGSYKLQGAIAGFVVGAAGAALVLYSGGSNSLCDSSSNQDAMNTRECVALIAAGGVVGGLAGYLIGGRINRSVRWDFGARSSHVMSARVTLTINARVSRARSHAYSALQSARNRSLLPDL